MVNFELSRIKICFHHSNENPLNFAKFIKKTIRNQTCIKPLYKTCSICELKSNCLYKILFPDKQNKCVLKPDFENKNCIDLTILGSSFNLWESLIDVLNKSSLNIKNIYYYHPFADKYYEMATSIVPRFNAINFFDLITGESKITVKIYPSILENKRLSVNLFISQILNRVINIANTHGIVLEHPNIDLSKIKIVKKNINISYFYKYSHKQNRKLKIPAISADLEISGEINLIYPYLSIVENTSFGKFTDIGFGCIKVF